MKIKIFLILVLFNINSYSQKYDDFEIIKTIIKTKQISHLLELDSLINCVPVRIIDLTNMFVDSTYIYEIDNKCNFIFLSVWHYIPIDLNTGHARDLIISKFEEKDDIYFIEIYMSPYYSCERIKNRLFIKIEIYKEDESYNIKSISGGHVD